MSLRIRGGNRFEGYGNVLVGGEGTLRGWQLTCSGCNEKSPVIYRRGPSYPPKVLYQMFRTRGWKLTGDPGADLCFECQRKKHEKAEKDRKTYIRGSVDQLLDLIRQLDLMLASNVSVEYGPYQPQIAAQLRSLFETAYLCNMFPGDLLAALPRPNGPSLILPDVSNLDTPLTPQKMSLCDVWDMASDDERNDWWDTHMRHQLRESMIKKGWTPPGTSPAPPPDSAPAPVASAPPSAPEHRRMNPRTAAMLVEMRKAIFGDT
jgi:hypothetical protein